MAPITKVEEMDFQNLPPARDPDERMQFDMLKWIVPGFERLVFFCFEADVRLHAKHALINSWRKYYEDYPFMLVNFDEFITGMVRAIRDGNLTSEMGAYLEPQTLIMDNFHLLLGKEATQEEFLMRVLQPRLEAGKTTVLFSEYSLSDMADGLRKDLRNFLRLAMASEHYSASAKEKERCPYCGKPLKEPEPSELDRSMQETLDMLQEMLGKREEEADDE